MHQRRRATVIFVRRVGVEDLRNHVGLLGPSENASFKPGDVVGWLQIRKRKDVGRIVEIEERPCVTRRLCELMVEISTSSACDVRPDSIENPPSLLVAIEPLV